MRYKRICYNLNVMRQCVCLVINPITVDGYAALLNCTPVDRASDLPFDCTSSCSLLFCYFHDGPDLMLFILVGWDRSFRLLLGPPWLN